MTGDRGDLCAGDKQASQDALGTGGRIVSAYGDGDARLWPLTEAADDTGDRGATTYLQPDKS